MRSFPILQQLPLAMIIALCNIAGMTQQPNPLKPLIEDKVLSQPYASQLLSGNRQPGLRLAIKIYRRVGMKLGPLIHASKSEIDLLEKVGAKRVTQ